MITAYTCSNHRLAAHGVDAIAETGVVWIDLDHPTADEIALVEKQFSIEIPSAEDMREIEISSRLYQLGEAHVMTTSIIYDIESQNPLNAEITFLLLPSVLITTRFATPRSFPTYAGRAATGDIPCDTPAAVAVGLLDSIVEREADLIERLQSQSETVSRQIFELKGHQYTRARRYAVALKDIGRVSNIASRTRESLVSLNRLLTYFHSINQQKSVSAKVRQRIKTVLKDVQSLTAHVDHLAARQTFLMDATVGLVSIEQNQIIKLFSVVAVMLMPPTLIASIYGMNFRHMPELDFPWAYPVVLVLMVVSAIVPFVYFRRKGWL